MHRHRLEVIARQATYLGHCTFCDNVMIRFKINPFEDQTDEYPREIREKMDRLAEVINAVANRYRDMEIVILDGASITGLLKMIRYRCSRDPIFILDGKVIHSGSIPGYTTLAKIIDAYLLK